MKVLLRNVRSNKRKAKLLDLNSITRKRLEQDLDHKVKPALIKSHQRIVADWESDVDFAARKFITTNSISVNIFPTGKDKKIWFYVDLGTKPHKIPGITPVNAQALKFQGGGKYQSKTLARPARTVSGGGKVTGGVTVYAKRTKDINHPGSEGRNFSGQIAEDEKPGFIRIIEGSFREVAQEVQE